MNLLDLVSGPVGQQLIGGLSNQTGASDSSVSSAVSLALPFLLSQMNKNASTPEGAANLDKALNDHPGSVLNNIDGLLNSGNMADGLGILGHVFGDKQNQVAQNIGKQSGLSTGNVLQILATLAPIVMGFLGKQKQSNNIDQNGISGLLGGLLGGMQQTNGTELSMIEKMLDSNGDGSIMDEAMDLGSKLLGGFFKK
ncbi:DUF937 domain-containing protein [Weeksellaceae bacterium KMM 9713]|uniref:DUF937 domain-containing protein n=1 Tax=Profundicola chukchiensis TaxID=2961959 RepID=A0A9X4RUW1_9FLAO|nr:DUF937 domain-containing protein [Profundicola chukchiensis]MDG4946081.1 DUF937 domain-containing protein [Profundicola chukchiensis]